MTEAGHSSAALSLDPTQAYMFNYVLERPSESRQWFWHISS